MNVPHRCALQAGVALVVAVAGCVGGFGGVDYGGATTTDDRPREVTPSGDPVSANATVERDTVEYLESEDAIRYVAAWRHTNQDEIENGSEPEREPVYETVPFAEWAETECPSAGLTRMNGVLSSRLDEPVEGVSVGITTENGTVVIVVEHATLYDRSGARISTPSVSFDRLASATPERVSITLTIENRTTSCTAPVVVQSIEMHQD